MPQPSRLSLYPGERIFLGQGTSAAFGLHATIAGVIILVAFFTHVKTIEQLMSEGGSIAQTGPAPEQTMEVVLRPDDLPPPPPTPTPEFVRQIEEPKPIPPPPVPVEQPTPKPVVVAKPKFTAPKATGTGESASVSQLVVGSSGFPKPGYPYEAKVHHQSGTVTISIQFDASGNAARAEIVDSSGYHVLDSSTISFVESHWKNESFSGRYVTVPVDYRL